MAIKKINTTDLVVGMFVSKVHSSWLNAPIAMKNIKIESQKNIDNLIDYDIQTVSIDTSKGIDVGEMKETKFEEPTFTDVNTFEADLNKFRINRPVPVDFYYLQSGKLEHVLKKELSFSNDVFELFMARGISNIRIPKEQKAAYDKYMEKIENENEIRKEAGYSKEFVDPEKVKRQLDFLSNYHPVNPLSLVPGAKTTFVIFLRDKDCIKTVVQKNGAVHSDQRDMWIEQDSNLLVLKTGKEAYQAYLVENARTSKDEKIRMAFVRENSKLLVEGLAENPRSGKLMMETKSAVADLTQNVMDNPATFYSMTKINNHDYYTFTHSVNVSTMSLAMAMAHGINDEKDLSDIGLGSIVHDVGKAMVDNAIINKPGKLTDVEFAKMKDHVTLGVEMLRQNEAITERLLIPALQHHEKLSGKGYPNKLAGDEIHLFGRIASLMDIYDALTTERSYKKAFKPYDALAIIFKGQEDYDPILLSILVKTLGDQDS